MARQKINVCKTKGCELEPIPNSKMCEKHYFPRNEPQNQLLIPDMLQALYNKYRKKDEEREKDGKIHISSINLCMRESVFRRLKPEPMTPRKLKWFTNGSAIHEKAQALLEEFPDKYEKEKEVTLGKNIVAHIDLYNKEKKIPIEAKSLSGAGEEAPKNFHVNQLKMYMALTDADVGVMFYDPLLDFTDEAFSEWTIRMNQSERAKMLQEIETKAELYALAVERKDPSVASHIAYDPEYNWHCSYCTYVAECTEMRTKERSQMFQ